MSDERCVALDFGEFAPSLADIAATFCGADAADAIILALLTDAVERVEQRRLAECERLSRVLLDYTWERLHTGHWRQVSLVWRYVYSYASLLKSLCLAQTPDNLMALRACDMGLLMGAPILDNRLRTLASALHDKLLLRQPSSSDATRSYPKRRRIAAPAPPISSAHEIARVHCPSLETFLRDYYLADRAVIITGAMDGWPAMKKWSVEYICRVARHRTVPVEVGARYTDDKWSQQLMTVGEFVGKFMTVEAVETGYLAQYALLEQVAELSADVAAPDYCFVDAAAEAVDVNGWFGPAGTVSPLHTDPRANLLAHVFGAKYVRLVAAAHSHLVYPSAGFFANTSEVDDAETADLRRFPLFADAPYSESVLGAGEMLFIPKNCWHYLRAVESSFSVSFWFGE